MIILDFGSGNTCRNDKRIIKKMIDEVTECDHKKHEIIIKWQLFKDVPPNIPLTYDSFDYAYHYARDKGYQVTSSVLDKQSLDFLLKYDIPFVKIPCRPKLYWLIGEIPRRYKIVKSIDDLEYYDTAVENLFCVPKYPASIEDYMYFWMEGLSDHTIGWELYKQKKPRIYECHYVLEHDENNPDGGAWAHTPEDLKEIL